MLAAKKRKERLIALVLAGALALNYPLLFLFGAGDVVLGVPLLFFYLFLAWGVFIALVALVMHNRPRTESPAGSSVLESER